jgi:hypothetical protein
LKEVVGRRKLELIAHAETSFVESVHRRRCRPLLH